MKKISKREFDLLTSAAGLGKNHNCWPWLEKRIFIEMDNVMSVGLKDRYWQETPSPSPSRKQWCAQTFPLFL